MAEKDRNIRIRDKEIRVKVTDEELQYAKDKAECCGLTMSEYIRKVIKDGVVIKLETCDIKALTIELNKIGTNINQIAKQANETRGQSINEDMETLISQFSEMQQIIFDKVYGL